MAVPVKEKGHLVNTNNVLNMREQVEGKELQIEFNVPKSQMRDVSILFF